MLKDLRKQLDSAYRSHLAGIVANESVGGIKALNVAMRPLGLRSGDGAGACQTCNDSTGRPPSDDNPFGK